ncbi:hypothetical protein HHK36_020963 [Tetracentron sinense]|uniref:Diacylglycerol O-acyltransferase 3, cytosolic n=1 Tax=Tetracentron sinense TaxID=13715 RepID=A0A834YZU7_TETSI|nr:hypothetical protein HHK36_020963 [Tetracentron sinense]
MEVQGVVFRSLPCFSGADFDTRYLNPSFSGLSFDAGNRFAGDLRLLCSRDSKVSVRSRKFPDDGNLQYYVAPRSGGRKKEKEKEKGSKKRLKLIKGLSRDLSVFYGMGFGVETEDGLIGEVKGKMISVIIQSLLSVFSPSIDLVNLEATEILLAQLQQLRAEEKELNKKRKEDKAKLKATRRFKDMVQIKVDERPQQEIQEATTSTSLSLLIPEEKMVLELKGIEDGSLQSHGEECCYRINTSCTSVDGVTRSSVVADRIEVCMGGKCKKSGAAALLEEFERRVGVDGAVVVGCKCMGKCRDGPNVRVLNGCKGIQAEGGDDGSFRLPANPLCIGVGLEDVSTIVANFFGEERKDLGLMAAA